MNIESCQIQLEKDDKTEKGHRSPKIVRITDCMYLNQSQRSLTIYIKVNGM